MRNRMFLTLILSLCMADFGAFAAPATRGNARGTAAANNAAVTTQSAPVAARAASRQKVANTSTAQTSNATSGNVAARAGKKQTVVSNNASAPKPMAARAGATQKVINTGQKVATATANTVVPQECQDAFYGCMDSFCMLDNASGGRCQCSDRVVELDKVLEDILKLDEQTYIMATEGVERIQMGEAEEQIMARAKAAADKVTVEEKKQENQKKVRTLDLSAWNNNIFSEEDVFGSIENSADLVDTFADKKGDELYKAAAKLCVKQIPTQCNAHGQMMQLVYAQKIKSDCSAYENSLKQQKIASQQKLQTAQKALRDAALDEYKNQNKYGTAGECAVAFAQCMQNDAGCGSDYTGCVTLAAKENVKNNQAGTKAKQTTIKGAVSSITLAASTMESLLAKKEICQKVVKQCVAANSRDDVWTLFLRNAAPALKSAEEMAESNLRMQCIPTIAECYKTACKSTINPNDEQGSYDMCLSNPDTYKSLCKVQLEPCLEATGGSYDDPTKSSLWNGLVAALNSMKVDACTNQVRSCLTERCGDDFAGCVGLDTETIGNLCPKDKLTACMTNYNPETVRDYVAEIAQGLAVQIDNSMLTVCQKAVNDSMMKVCGDTETCDALVKDDKLGAKTLEYQICSFRADEAQTNIEVGACKSSLDQISDKEWNEWVWIGNITGLLYWGHIDYNYDTEKFTSVDNYVKAVNEQFGGIKDEEKQMTKDVFDTEIAQLQSTINNTISAIESDPIVTYCMTGREVQGFSASKTFGKKTKRVFNEQTNKFEMADASASRFPKLTEQTKHVIIANALKGARDNYQEKYEKVLEQLMKDQVASAAKNDREKATEAAKNTCDTWAVNSVLPRSKTPTNIWAWIGMAIAVAVAVVASVFTAGAALGAEGALIGSFMAAHGATFAALGTAAAASFATTTSTVIGLTGTVLTVTTAMPASFVATLVAGTVGSAVGVAAGVGGTVAGAVEGAKHEANRNKSDTTAGPGYAELDQWNYKAKIKTMYNPNTGECTKETIYQNCTKESWSTGKCKVWGPEKTETQTMKLI